MQANRSVIVICSSVGVLLTLLLGPQGGAASAQAQSRTGDPVKALVGRLDLERYKATIKSLTQFGDRLQGTDRNKAAIDWIEAQLRSYGCIPDRLRYVYTPAPATGAPPAALPSGRIASGQVQNGPGGSRLRGMTTSTSGSGPASPDLNAQSDPALRALNTQTAPPGPREEVYCTKVGTTRPDEMYIVGSHMDGRGLGEGADDNASGTALVMELARIFSSAVSRSTSELARRSSIRSTKSGGLARTR